MPIARPRSPFVWRHLVAASAVLLLAGCVGDAVTPPLAPDEAPALGKAATGPAVTSTLPKSGGKGLTLDVHVYGSGFANGATATWALHGVADPSKVRTNGTTFVSSTELIANITIAPDATIDYWDVQVAAAVCCKTGVGSELFEVTTATPVGPGIANGVNDAGDIVGGSGTDAYALSGADASFSDLGLRKATAISQSGLIAVGGVDGSAGSPFAGVWTRAVGAPWPAAGARLPDVPGMTQTAGLATAVGAVPAEGVTLISGNLVLPSTPVYWESADGTWTSPARRLPLPAAYAASPQNIPSAIATNGDIAGHVQEAARGSLVPVLWRRVAGSYVVDVLPLPSGYTGGQVGGISPDGTVLAGGVRKTAQGKNVLAPAFWTRDGNGGYTVQLLPTLTGSYNVVGAVNDIGVHGVTVVGNQVRAVGTSQALVNASFIHGVVWTWTVGSTDFVVRDMGGVGTKTDVTPNAINAAGTIAVGGDGTGSIRWRLLP